MMMQTSVCAELLLLLLLLPPPLLLLLLVAIEYSVFSLGCRERRERTALQRSVSPLDTDDDVLFPILSPLALLFVHPWLLPAYDVERRH